MHGTNLYRVYMSLKEIGLGNYSELILHSLSEVVSFGQGCR